MSAVSEHTGAVLLLCLVHSHAVHHAFSAHRLRQVSEYAHGEACFTLIRAGVAVAVTSVPVEAHVRLTLMMHSNEGVLCVSQLVFSSTPSGEFGSSTESD